MEFLRDSQWLWWVAGALLLGVLEVASLDLVFAMLSVAALAAALASAVGAPLVVQVLVFSGAATLLLALVRPLALSRFEPSGQGQLTNVAALVGRSAQVLARVSDRGGQVKLAGEVWSARSDGPGVVSEAGDDVVIVRIDGATAVVRPTERPEHPPGPPQIPSPPA